MDATDLDELTLPEWVRLDVLRDDRSSLVAKQSIPVNLNWWNDRLKIHDLPGGPLEGRSQSGDIVRVGRAQIAREDVFRVASLETEGGDAIARLLWFSLAWGAGLKIRQCDRRMLSFKANREVATRGLIDAARLSRESPKSAYLTVCPSPHQNLVKYLGPAFATKFLYFAGGGDPGHRSLILDSVVATALKTRCGWTSLSTTHGWPASTYERYCDLLQRWSSEASVGGRTVAPDEIELALFNSKS